MMHDVIPSGLVCVRPQVVVWHNKEVKVNIKLASDGLFVLSSPQLRLTAHYM